MDWFKERLNSLVDNLIWIGLVALVVAVGGSVLAFGGDRADLPVWLVVLFGVVLLGCVVAIGFLFNRTSDLERKRISELERKPVPAPEKQPHPHAKLLQRIDGLAVAVARREADSAADWPAAAAFNGILRDARDETQDPLLSEIDEVERSHEYQSVAYSATNGTITTLLAQVRSIVE